MATDQLTLRVTTDTRTAMRVFQVLRPLVRLRLLSTSLATSLIMRFVRIEVRPEGWGGD